MDQIDNILYEPEQKVSLLVDSMEDQFSRTQLNWFLNVTFLGKMASATIR